MSQNISSFILYKTNCLTSHGGFYGSKKVHLNEYSWAKHRNHIKAYAKNVNFERQQKRV